MEEKKKQKQKPSCSQATKPISSAIQMHQEPPGFLLEVCHSATKMLQVQKLEEGLLLLSPLHIQLCQPLLTTQRKQKTEASSHLSQTVSRSRLLFTFTLKSIIDAYHSQNQITSLPPQKQFYGKPFSLPKSSASWLRIPVSQSLALNFTQKNKFS